MIKTKHVSSLRAAALLLAQLTIASAQPLPEPAAPASAPEQTSTLKETKAAVGSNQIPKLVIRWDRENLCR